MPEAIRELLRPGAAAGIDAAPKYHDDDLFNYEYTTIDPKHHEAAAASAEVPNGVGGVARNAAAASPTTMFFLEDAVRVGGVLPICSTTPRDTANAAAPPLRLYTVRAVRAVDGCRFVVCRRDREAGGSGPDADNNDERDAAVYGCRATTTGLARAYVVGMVGERGETATAAVVCRTDVSRWSRAAFWLLGVKPGGAAAVCHAALDAQVIPVKNDRSSSLV